MHNFLCLLIRAPFSRYIQRAVLGVLNLLSTGSKLVCFFILAWLLFCLLPALAKKANI